VTSPTDQEVVDYEAAQLREYSKWMAAELITHAGVPAYNVGDPVPISNVDAHGYGQRGQVLLQHAYVADNPDDEDVKTFLDYVKANPEHPAAVAWKDYRDRQAEEARRAKAAAPPLVFGTHAEKTSGKPAKASPATTAEKG